MKAGTVSSEVRESVAAVRADIEARGNAHDLAYFDEHERRFTRTARRLLELLPERGTLLDAGSHYLHSASILSSLGFRVIGVDVPEFTRLPFVQERARAFSIENHTLGSGGLADGDVLGDATDEVDGVVFCEILEHITFNPISFWHRVYDLLRPGGIVYITTPNGLQLLAVLGAVWNALTLKRRGIHVEHIFSNVTYGHHWKEYGAGEIREYFARLSPDFAVAVRGFTLGAPDERVRKRLGPAKTLLLRLGNTTDAFAENLEAVVRLRERTRWLAKPPAFG